MRKLVVLTVLILSGVIGTSTAQAKWFIAPGKAEKIKSVEWRITAYEKNVHTAKSVIRFAHSHTYLYTYKQWTRTLRDHRWMLNYSLLRIEELHWMTRPPNYYNWLCIHHYEGSWSDSGDPYWGGLQMDRGFMRTYAPAWLLRKGWANRWTPLEQMWVAENAKNSGRGFGPWPNTARYCGLL
jgi:hypothetical protein